MFRWTKVKELEPTCLITTIIRKKCPLESENYTCSELDKRIKLLIDKDKADNQTDEQTTNSQNWQSEFVKHFITQKELERQFEQRKFWEFYLNKSEGTGTHV